MKTTFCETLQDKKTFGERLRLTRTTKGYTQKTLADAIDYTRTCLALWENGHGSPNVHAITAIADVLDCSVDELFGREVKPGTVKAEKRRAFSQALRAQRKAQGWTQYELAQRVGCDESTINHWEKGRTNPSLKTVINLADLFGCSLDEILGRRVKG